MKNNELYKMLKDLKDTDGATLKNYKAIEFKTGYQVATEGIETKSIDVAINAINNYNGDAGIWKNNNIYYIDKSYRVKTKAKALEVGKKHNQISVLKWKDKSLIYCNECE